MILTLVLFLLDGLKRVRVKFGDTKQYLAMSERRSQERDRETVSRDKENIGRHRLGAAAACSLSVSLTPGLGTEGTIPRLATSRRHRLEQRRAETEAGHSQTPGRESYTTCADISRTQTTIGKFSGNLFRVHQRDLSLADTCQGGQVSGFLPWPVNNADSKVRGNTK